MKLRRRRMLLILLAFTLLAASCGDDDSEAGDTPSDDDTADDDSTGDDSTGDDDDATVVVGGVVVIARAVVARAVVVGGVVAHRHAGGVVRATTLERTLVDVLDKPDKAGGWEEVWRSLEMVEFFDLDPVADYALKLGSALTVARVGFYLEQHRDALMVEDDHLEALRPHAPARPLYFDSKRETGRLVSGWNVIVPQRILERSWEEAA